MDSRHGQHLRPGTRVAVAIGTIVSDVQGTPPMVTTGTLMEKKDEGHWWVDTDIAVDETLPQIYRIEEIIGILFPMATVQRSEDGQSAVGTLPSGYIGP